MHPITILWSPTGYCLPRSGIAQVGIVWCRMTFSRHADAILTNNIPRNILNDPVLGSSPEDTKILQTMIAFGIEINPKILEVRSLRHRHHGLWYDLRSIMTASLILLALVRSGNGALIPGGLEELVGQHPHFSSPTDPTSHLNGDADGFEIGGMFKIVLRAFEFWADESPDLRRAARVLRELIRETVEMVTRQNS